MLGTHRRSVAAWPSSGILQMASLASGKAGQGPGRDAPPRPGGHRRVRKRRFTAGGSQVPSRIDGSFSRGQYRRSIRMNWSWGAGSQLDSLSLPGDSFWRYRSSEPSALYFQIVAGADRVLVERVRHEEVLGVVHGQRPEAVGRRRLALGEVHHVLVGPAIGLAVAVHLGGRIDCVLGPVGAEADGGDEGPLQVVGAVDPGLGQRRPSR